MYSILFTVLSLIFGSYAMAMEPIDSSSPMALTGFLGSEDSTIEWDPYILTTNLSESNAETFVVNFAEEKDPIVNKTLSELLAFAIEEERDFIIARTVIENNEKEIITYYELPNLHKSLCDGSIWPEDGNSWLSSLKAMLQYPNYGPILYFIYHPTEKIFKYFGTNLDVYHEHKQLRKIIIDAAYNSTDMPSDKLANLLYRAGNIYYNQNSMLWSIVYFERAAKLGHSDSMAALGHIYRYMNPPNNKKALQILKDGARAHNLHAMRQLALLYLQLDPVNKRTKALDLLAHAAGLDHCPSLHEIGTLYCNGTIDGEPDFIKGSRLYRKILSEPNATEYDKDRALKAMEFAHKKIAELYGKHKLEDESSEQKQKKTKIE